MKALTLIKLAITTVLVTYGTSRAGLFTITEHTATGQGTANVFDGGPPITVGGSLGNPNLEGFSFLASDFTQPGSFGGTASSSGRSQIVDLDQGIRILVNFNASYSPSLFPNGDRPGGESEGWLSSVIEFEMPVDEIFWGYQLFIRNIGGSTGASAVTFENISQQQTLLSITDTVLATGTTLIADPGDLMRITTEMSGAASGPPNDFGSRFYDSMLEMVFLVPEPSTALLLAIGTLPLLRRKHRPRHARV